MEELQKLQELSVELRKASDIVKKPSEVLDLIWDIEALLNNRPTVYGSTPEEYILMAQNRLKQIRGY